MVSERKILVTLTN